jgi:hypothetical protein
MQNTKKTFHKIHNKTMKKMNCSPLVNGKSRINGSCFTDDVLYKLKKSYNQNYPNHKIKERLPVKIWIELQKRMSQCTKEDCWLNVIQNENERKKLDKFLFSPDKPKEWKQNPNTWLSNYDIFNVLYQYELTYNNFKIIGPSPIDYDMKPTSMNGNCVWNELCKFSLSKMVNSGKTKIGIVFNLGKHDTDGYHWVSMFIDVKDKFIFYFDSAGASIPNQINKLVNKIIKQGENLENPIHFTFYQNHPLEHQMGNTECGMYSLYFIITMLSGELENKRRLNKTQKINYFMKKRIPDEDVSNYRDIYFN